MICSRVFVVSVDFSVKARRLKYIPPKKVHNFSFNRRAFTLKSKKHAVQKERRRGCPTQKEKLLFKGLFPSIWSRVDVRGRKTQRRTAGKTAWQNKRQAENPVSARRKKKKSTERVVLRAF
jgi:hypothetical protein